MKLIITENQLDHWVRSNATVAQGVIVELVWRLVAAASPKPQHRRFALGDSTGQPGPDGFLDTEFPFKPFVPEGKSYWEIGTGVKAGKKATDDYRNRTKDTPCDEREASIFIFVTPLSGRTDWQFTWKENAQATWIKNRKAKNEWRDVRVIDGTQLIDWLHQFPAVGKWLAKMMDIPIDQIDTLTERWSLLKSIGDPPPLLPQLFLDNREIASKKLDELFSGSTLQIKLETYFPDQVVDFVAAYVANLDEDTRVDTEGRCLIVTGPDGLRAVSTLKEPHVLVVAYDTDDQDTTSTTLLEKARRARHAMILRGMPGGIPHPGCVSVRSPKSHHIEAALIKAGYKEERARSLSQKCNGNLSALLKCLQNLSLMPEWAQDNEAAKLAIADLLGGWNENSKGDQQVVEYLSGNSYGEWIGTMRKIALRPGTPLTQFEGHWKFVARYEGWHSLGPQLFDEHLKRFEEQSVVVLGERDPQFDLAPEERYAAGIHKKVPSHSDRLRNGIAETLALLGSLPQALTSCTRGKAELTATIAVRTILEDADWVCWASVNQQMPLLAEAAPHAFLEAVETALQSDPCPFDVLFSQEGNGLSGENYMTGLLWALETLAWSPEYLSQAMLILGNLAARDPGGSWANRPQRSLSTILLPWCPQTVAPIAKRQASVAILIEEQRDVAWKLLMELMPDRSHMSWGSRKPAWRGIIDEDWSPDVSIDTYWTQIDIYSDMALQIARQDSPKLAELLGHLDDLPPHTRKEVVRHLQSDEIRSLPETERLDLWEGLLAIVRKHRKYRDANWAMSGEEVDELDVVARQLSPKSDVYRFRRLFAERTIDLIEEEGDYEQQQHQLEEKRFSAVHEILNNGGLAAVQTFAESVETPWHVGFALGKLADNNIDPQIFPKLLNTESNTVSQFAWGVVSGRLQKQSWNWVDGIDSSHWTTSETGQFLSCLPFCSHTWDRTIQRLQDDQGEYWRRASVNPYAADQQMNVAIDRLVEYGRPYEALMCLERTIRGKSFDSKQAIRALTAFSHLEQVPKSMDSGMVVEIIGALQNDPATDPNELIAIEVGFLPILNTHFGGSPKLLERKMADDPSFFCDAIQAVFHSKNDKRDSKPDERHKALAQRIYKLLRNWRAVPGMGLDGSFSGSAFSEWLAKVKKSSKESGHLDVSLSHVGQVLIHAPANPDGLWIHESVAKELNAKDAERLRNGYRLALYNSRGTHWVDPTGQPERDLAQRYRNQADDVELRGYHRLATALRALADSYDREAEQIVERQGFDD